MPRASRPAKDEGASLADLLEPVGGEPTHVLGPTPRPSLSRAASPAVGARDADGETATRIHRPSSSAPSHAVIDDDSATSVRSGETFPSRGSLVSQESPALFGTELPAGTIIGRYMIVEPLGSGGLGDVYTAYDPELDRRLAIKLLRPTPGGTGDSGAGSGSDRLQREAKAMARLAHPNVVAVHDVGRAGDDVFIAMERVEGLTLSQWIRAETRPWTVIRDVFLGAGRGLAAAHDAGIVHRDFKPANVIVSADGRPRVLDFGLARAVEVDDRSGLMRLPRTQLPVGPGTSSLDDPITLPGTVMGTPQYMAPEQFEGSEHSGAASDQFSFCVALWFALYGRRPFSGDDVAGIIAAARAGRITEPSDRRGVPGWLHRVMLRGLSRDPGQRWPTMHALLHAMQRDRRSRRRQWIALATVAVLSAGGAAVAAVALRPPVTSEARDRVDVLVEEARAAAARSFYVYPAPDDPDGVTAYRKVLELEAQEGPIDSLADAAGGELRTELADTLVLLGDRYYEREGGRAFAADYYAAALIFRPEDEKARARTTLTPGELAMLRDKAAEGDFSEAELVAAASLSVLAVDDEQERIRRWSDLFAGDLSPSEGTVARLGMLLGQRETEAIEQASVARRTAPRAGRPVPKDEVRPEPEPEPDSAPEPTEETGGEAASELQPPPEVAPAPRHRDPAAAKELAAAGLKAFRKGSFSEAEGLFHRALSHNARNTAALGGLAELHFEQGSYQKAVKFAGQAVSASPKSGHYRVVLGDAYFKTLAYESARREYEKALALGHAKAKARLQQLDRRLGK